MHALHDSKKMKARPFSLSAGLRFDAGCVDVDVACASSLSFLSPPFSLSLSSLSPLSLSSQRLFNSPAEEYTPGPLPAPPADWLSPDGDAAAGTPAASSGVF